jgi:uncharacterized membrane protein
MAANPEIWIAIAGMALVSYACRAGGYGAMAFVRMTPRVEGWLAAMPSALVAAILARTLASAGPVEIAGVAAAFLVARFFGGDFAGMMAGIVAVALLRSVGA